MRERRAPQPASEPECALDRKRRTSRLSALSLGSASWEQKEKSREAERRLGSLRGAEDCEGVGGE